MKKLLASLKRAWFRFREEWHHMYATGKGKRD